jgi:hypothetical protein
MADLSDPHPPLKREFNHVTPMNQFLLVVPLPTGQEDIGENSHCCVAMVIC